MARSYVLNYVHCAFSTKGRAQLIRDPEPLWAYLRGIARNRGFDIMAVGGADNHVHVLLSVPAALHLVELVRDLKANSSRFMKTHVQCFAWQDGYAAVSVSPSQVETMKRYIARQQQHHSRQTFDEEFLALLDKASVRYDKSEPGEAMSGRKTRRVEMEQLPDVCLRRGGLGKSELSGMAAQDKVFRLAIPLIRNPRMRGAPGTSP